MVPAWLYHRDEVAELVFYGLPHYYWTHTHAHAHRQWASTWCNQQLIIAFAAALCQHNSTYGDRSIVIKLLIVLSVCLPQHRKAYGLHADVRPTATSSECVHTPRCRYAYVCFNALSYLLSQTDIKGFPLVSFVSECIRHLQRLMSYYCYAYAFVVQQMKTLHWC